MSVLDRLRSTQLSPRVAAFSIVGMLVVMTGVVMLVRQMADTAPVSAGKPAGISVTASEKKSASAARAGAGAGKDDPYQIIVERNLFRPVTGASPAPESPETAPPPPTPPQPPVQPMPLPVPSGKIDEVKKGVAFTGAVQIAGVQRALLENLQSKEARYTGQGESAFGYRVMSISSQLVVLEKNGLQFTLTLGENKPDAPPPAGKQGGQPGGQPGQQGGPEGQPRPEG